jgi:hypothetical protein
MTTRKPKESKLRKRINELYEENELANLEANKYRARSFTVGTAFGGIIEVSMRGDYNHMWCILQPVEAVEFIEQLAAAAGLQVALRPKQDFSSWRGWNVDTENKYWVGSAHWQLGDDDPARKAIGSANEEDQNILPETIENKKTTKRSRKKKVEVVTDCDAEYQEENGEPIVE